MTLADIVDNGLDPARGPAMFAQMQRLQPFFRSITGEGVRQTLAEVAGRLPLTIQEVRSGTEVYDWTVPPEWTVREAYIAEPDGRRVVDISESTLHLLGYSEPVRTRLSLDELRSHLHTLPEQPDLVPFRTSFYTRAWGFCLSHRALEGLRDDVSYDVVVDTDLRPGSLTYAECLLPGETRETVVLSTHVCHPWMANDNLSGIALLTALGELLKSVAHRYSYRLLFVPGTIGSLCWLSRNEPTLPSIRHGLVITGVGGPGPLVYKRTRHGNRMVDRAAAHVVGHRGGEVRPFSPWGYDERQFNSPGFDLPVGRLTRTPHGEYPEYHTSGDGLALVRPETMLDSLAAYVEVLDVLEHDATYLNLSPKGEPQLGKRGLFPSIGGRKAEDAVLAMLWVLNQSDGSRGLLDVADRSSLPFATVRRAAGDLVRGGLLQLVP